MKLDLEAARDRTIPDVLPYAGEPFNVLFLWILPNPSGLNASWPLPRIVTAFGELRAAAGDR